MKDLMECLFSYGTLQQESVQLDTYGRLLSGTEDHLLGYRMGTVEISDMDVVRKSGLKHHPVAIFTGNKSDEISGMIFQITQSELMASDGYEVAEYERVRTVLKSGKSCWVYVLREDLIPCKLGK